MVDCLIAYGVSKAKATQAVRTTTAQQNKVTMYDVYVSGHITEHAMQARRNLNRGGLRDIDLRHTRKNGKYGDLSRKTHQQEVLHLVNKDGPDWVIGGPPCADVCSLNVGLTFLSYHQRRRTEHIDRGLVHMRFMCNVHRSELRRGTQFLHEHPAAALSWTCPEIAKLLSDSRVGTLKCDQCQCGLRTTDADGERRPAKKPTRWMSTSPQMLGELGKVCKGEHAHAHLLGGRAGPAAYHPLPLVKAIIKGIKRTAQAIKATNSPTHMKGKTTRMITMCTVSSSHPPGLLHPNLAARNGTTQPSAICHYARAGILR